MTRRAGVRARSSAPGRTGGAGSSLGRQRSGGVVVEPDPEGAAKPSRSRGNGEHARGRRVKKPVPAVARRDARWSRVS
ncbi:hypothetical protein OJ998_34955 [Solirubrobacter taibaiensis]|nr:hypothetical protein [Solirubrobacter taibaiensis]